MRTKEKPAQRALGGVERDKGADCTLIHSHLTGNGQDRQILRNERGQACAEVLGGVLHKTIEDRHLYRRILGIACDVAILEAAARLGVTRCVVVNRSSKKVYHAPLEYFWDHGEEIDHGHGLQRVLPLKYWRVKQRAGPTQLTLAGL